jgi:hypothetical protein
LAEWRKFRDSSDRLDVDLDLTRVRAEIVRAERAVEDIDAAALESLSSAGPRRLPAKSRPSSSLVSLSHNSMSMVSMT